MKLTKLIFTLSVIFPILGFAHDLCPGIMPKNDLWIGIGNKNNPKEMTEAQFNQIINRVETIYGPLVKEKKKKLQIVRKWKDGTVNAYAQKTLFGELKVVMFGGMARHPITTMDSFALVVCHELGHHLGGIPQKVVPLSGKMSNEGQADYWGAMKCLRKYFENEDNAIIAAKLEVPNTVKEKCQDSFHNENEIGMCYRISMAGMAMAKLFNTVKPKPGVVLDFAKPDPKIVKETYDDHPEYQCRLDTYFQSALCDKDANIEPDAKDPDFGFCNKTEGYSVGLRPLCWFKPQA